MQKLFKISFFIIVFLSFNVYQLNGLDKKDLLERGKIIDSVRCRDPKFTYALYLPSKYSTTAKWPVIYVFDPAARGKLAVSGFMPAAEKYGYIVVSSNNSKNALAGAELGEVINYLFSDTEARLSIDAGRIYTAGFSGGSRVASMVALNSKFISGVIGCGACFPNYADLKNIPSFDYF